MTKFWGQKRVVQRRGHRLDHAENIKQTGD